MIARFRVWEQDSESDLDSHLNINKRVSSDLNIN